VLCDTLDGVFWWVFVVKIGLFIEYTSENGTPDIEYTITEKTVNLYILSSDFDKYRGKVNVSQTL